jgi:hypothetical protein
VFPLTQIRKHISAIVVIPSAGTLKGIELGGCKNRSSDWQRDRLVKSLLAGKTYTPFTSLICVFVTVTTPTFHTSPQRWILTAMRHKIPDDHFALFSHVHLAIK